MNDKMKITIEIPNTGLEEDILRKGEWEDDSLFGRSLRNALMNFTKDSFALNHELDKIRVEIEQLRNFRADNYDLEQYCDCFDARIIFRDDVFKILDKHKAESEET